MRLSAFFLLAFAAIGTHAADDNEIPPEILSGRTCEEHLLQAAPMTWNDLPRQARGREHNAVVVASFKLDGSGTAKDPTVVFSRPAKVFDQTTIALLGRTQFAPGAVEESCYYIRTYSAVRRSGC